MMQACIELLGENHGLPIGVSIGAVAVPEQGRDYQPLFSLADKALYQVKQTGKHGYAIYSDTVDAGGEGLSVGQELARLTMIAEERGEATHALWLGQDAFTGAYRFLMHGLKQNGGCATKDLFSILPGEGREMEGSVSEEFEDLLNRQLELGDAVSQIRQDLFFVLLPGKDAAAAERKAEQVKAQFAQVSGKAGYALEYALDTTQYPVMK
ncbi:MAG: diguanylate cyclase [Lachnospiraceae bacterium]|nr:diguanylate cyclase [Lachnospiraceae bacterium]